MIVRKNCVRRTVFSFIPGRRWLATHLGGHGTAGRGGGSPVRPFTGGRCLGGADNGAPSPKASEFIYRKSLFRNKWSSSSNPVLWIADISTVSSKILGKKILRAVRPRIATVVAPAQHCSNRIR